MFWNFSWGSSCILRIGRLQHQQRNHCNRNFIQSLHQMPNTNKEWECLSSSLYVSIPNHFTRMEIKCVNILLFLVNPFSEYGIPSWIDFLQSQTEVWIIVNKKKLKNCWEKCNLMKTHCIASHSTRQSALYHLQTPNENYFISAIYQNLSSILRQENVTHNN